jgi:hypothetical protein
MGHNSYETAVQDARTSAVLGQLPVATRGAARARNFACALAAGPLGSVEVTAHA